MNSIRMEHCRDRQFIEPVSELRLAVVSDQIGRYNLGLLGWNTDNPAVHFDPKEFESELAFTPEDFIPGNLVRREERDKKKGRGKERM